MPIKFPCENRAVVVKVWIRGRPKVMGAMTGMGRKRTLHDRFLVLGQRAFQHSRRVKVIAVRRIAREDQAIEFLLVLGERQDQRRFAGGS